MADEVLADRRAGGGGAGAALAVEIMSEAFHSKRFDKKVWITNHAIESMMKRRVTLDEVKLVVEKGEYRVSDSPHGWIFHHFPEREDNLVCVAVVDQEAIIIKTVMIDWKLREQE